MIQILTKVFWGNSSNKLINIIANYTLAYSHIYNLVLSIAFFMLFNNIYIKCNFFNKVIKFITPLLLGVTLFHCHPALVTYAWTNLLKPMEFFNTPYFILIEILYVLGIFITGCVVEFLRLKLVDLASKLTNNNIYINRIENRIEKNLYNK